MMLKLKSSLLLAILSIILYSCEKEYSLEGSKVGGTSVFTFTGAPGACINPVVTGTYNVGTPLGATNTVTIAVDVTTPGTYIVSTAVLNGFSFNGSGTFTTIGAQTIELIGSGTPVADGIFSFTPGSAGCSFTVTVSSGGGGTSVYTLAGTPGTCTNFSPSGVYAAGTPLAAGNFVTVSVDVTRIGTYIITTNTLNGIAFSSTGEFTATGVQAVQLAGSGTPLAGGAFDFTAGTNGCTFSLTVTGSSTGSAVFTYVGAPGSCTTVTPAGTYTAATALSASNTVTINVNVTTIGTWAISTGIANGFSFSGSGTFTTTGIQPVTLTGTGTPTAAGATEFTPSNGCSFSITVETGTPATDFLKCTIDGVASTFNVNLLGESPAADTISVGGDKTSDFGSAAFRIIVVKSPAVTPGSYDKLSFTNISTYCQAFFLDGTTLLPWSPGLLQGEEFTVVVTSNTGGRIQGTFAGTLYDGIGLGSNAKVVTGGQFSVPY